ncbi:helicase associated domain-containing protein [Streptomyces lavendulae]|uniref:helicase associated domain-containing protein n=1 Tax=Streptomyces lavendulae TaxID=1914 RepID=UPI00369CB213
MCDCPTSANSPACPWSWTTHQPQPNLAPWTPSFPALRAGKDPRFTGVRAYPANLPCPAKHALCIKLNPGSNQEPDRLADAAFEESLAAARAYYALHGTLAAPRGAAILDVQIGQWLTNVRRPGGLGKDPARAARRAAALATIDADWNPAERGWTVDWQRHYAYLTQLLASGTRLADVAPGVTLHGEDVGRWLATQRRDFTKLNEEQRARLGELGVKKAVRARTAPAKTGTTAGPGASGRAFHRGVQALTQYVGREGRLPGRGVVQVLADGSEHRTGIWLGNTKARRNRLDAAQLAALAELGLEPPAPHHAVVPQDSGPRRPDGTPPGR